MRHGIVGRRARLLVSAALGLVMAAAPLAEACTRLTYLGPDGNVVTGRSFDWEVSMHTNLWAFPAGVARAGAAGANSLTWTSKYGSVAAAGYDAGTADGINEKGLVANLLYLGAADYGARDARPGLSVVGWAQYVLDNFSTVAEAVTALQAESFQVVGLTLPGGFRAGLHLSLSDRSGDSAVLEYIKGKLVIHHGRQYQVMTNDPSFDQQLALDTYWREIGGAAMLPGTARPADRFVRTVYYLSLLPQTADPERAVTDVYSVLRNASVPFGVTTPGQPNVAATLWRSVADQKRLVYYFESAESPDIFWVDVTKLDLSKGQPVRFLLVDGKVLSGETSAQFVATAKPYVFLPADGS